MGAHLKLTSSLSLLFLCRSQSVQSHFAINYFPIGAQCAPMPRFTIVTMSLFVPNCVLMHLRQYDVFVAPMTANLTSRLRTACDFVGSQTQRVSPKVIFYCFEINRRNRNAVASKRFVVLSALIECALLINDARFKLNANLISCRKMSGKKWYFRRRRSECASWRQIALVLSGLRRAFSRLWNEILRSSLRSTFAHGLREKTVALN